MAPQPGGGGPREPHTRAGLALERNEVIALFNLLERLAAGVEVVRDLSLRLRCVRAAARGSAAACCPPRLAAGGCRGAGGARPVAALAVQPCRDAKSAASPLSVLTPPAPCPLPRAHTLPAAPAATAARTRAGWARSRTSRRAGRCRRSCGRGRADQLAAAPRRPARGARTARRVLGRPPPPKRTPYSLTLPSFFPSIACFLPARDLPLMMPPAIDRLFVCLSAFVDARRQSRAESMHLQGSAEREHSVARSAPASWPGAGQVPGCDAVLVAASSLNPVLHLHLHPHLSPAGRVRRQRGGGQGGGCVWPGGQAGARICRGGWQQGRSARPAGGAGRVTPTPCSRRHAAAAVRPMRPAAAPPPPSFATVCAHL